MHSYGLRVSFTAALCCTFLLLCFAVPAQGRSSHLVSGTITPADISVGATVSLISNGQTIGTTVVDSLGNYSFSGLSWGSYTVVPTKDGVQFSPASQAIKVRRYDVTGVNFTASVTTAPSTYSISGTITGGAGATVALSGAQTGTTTADSSGNFTFTGLANGTYTITPSKSGYTMSPASNSVTVNGADVTGVSFTATVSTHSISGSISGASSVNVALTGVSTGSTITDANGNYSFTGLTDGSYTVTPSLPGYTFSPSNANVSVNGSDVTGTNFTSSPSSTGSAPVFVQETENITYSGTSVSATYSSGVKAGNTLIVYAMWDNSGPVQISDSIGTTFKPVSPAVIWNGGASAQVFYGQVGVTGIDKVTATFGTSINSFGILYIHEYSGIDAINPVDVTKSASGTGSAMDSGFASTSSSNDLIFGAGASSQNVTAAGSGFTVRSLGYGNITEEKTAQTTGSYNATATHNGYGWAMQMVAFRPASGTLPSGYSISGTITGGAGSTVTLSGASSASTTADASGNYSFTGLANGTYAVTPSKSGYSFSPSSQSVTINGSNATAVNFTATAATYTISGTISGGSGATVALSGSTTASTTADSSGNYSFSVANGTYTVTPTKSGYSFSPANQSVTVNGTNVTGVNFSASAVTYSLSGNVSGTTGVTVSLTGASAASTTTDTNGNFTFTGLANGAYTVTPSKSGFSFSPTSKSVNINGTNITGINFSATSGAYSISGTITGGAGATVALSGGSTASVTADANGAYTFTKIANGTYTITPSLTGYTFSPANQSVTVNGANLTAVDFTATQTTTSHSVDLSWTASTTSTVSGYKVYRSTTSGGPYTNLNANPVTSTIYTDQNVTSGATYFYVVTAVDSSGAESGYSNEAKAVIPNP